MSGGAGIDQRRDPGDFRKTIVDLGRTRSSAVEVFGDFCRMAACCYAVQTREGEYLEVAKRYEKEELNQFARAMGQLVLEMEREPFKDVLGPYYQEIASPATVDSRGEFYTPPALCSVMARIVVDPESVIARGKPITVSDPCIGSGGMILAIAKHFAPDKAVDLLRVTGTDVSPVACDMAYINTTLWGIPATIIHGNTLTLEVQNVWKNVHWARVGEDGRQAVVKMQDLLNTRFVGEAKSEPSVLPVNSDVALPGGEERKKLQQGELF